MSSQEYTHNHYVPEWYQRRFLPDGKGKFYFLNLHRETVSKHGHTFKRKSLLRWGPPSCFAQNDLYSTQWFGPKNTDIEKFFFGEIDRKGRAAIRFFDDYEIKNGLHESFQDLVSYMSVQKLRTPKGLLALARLLKRRDKNQLLLDLQKYQNMHCAIWTDAVWQIASAEESPTKFIISDHPVTVYNRGCFPASKHCGQVLDPDIRLVASQTIFPISPNKVIILTNLAWARNPYQKPLNLGPNKKMFHNTIFKGTSIQQGRVLSETEVQQINYIIKMRAFRYLAAVERDWLFPEKQLKSTHWSKFGDGYLLMPEPRELHMGGEVLVGYKDGSSESWNEYGQRPWEKGYSDDKRNVRESKSLDKFQDEFAALYGADWRGWSKDFGNDGLRSDSPEFYIERLKRAENRGIRVRKPTKIGP